MAITTLEFWYVFVAFLALYYLLKKYTPNLIHTIYVLAFSLFFFYNSNGWLGICLPITGLLTWSLTELMKKCEGQKAKKRVLWLTIAADLLPLLYFKYNKDLIEMAKNSIGDNFPLESVAMIGGISFYTFQAISYTVDVYRGRFTDKVNIVDFLFYLTFFPLVIAGPITRAETFFPQMRRKGDISERTMNLGIWLMITGIMKKCVLADYLAQYNNWIFDEPTAYSGFENLMGVLGYTSQIYCDFSGFSDLSIGIACLMGIRLRDNFNFPYSSTNVTEFWRRWHMSLSFWFRDYLYIPLGGNRKGKFRTYLNNFITMIVAGIWHGATAMFVIWGALHGLGLIIHKAAKNLFLDKIPNYKVLSPIWWTLTYIWVAFAWTYFRGSSLETVHQIFIQIATDFDMAYLVPFVSVRTMWTILCFLPLVISLIEGRRYRRIQTWFICLPWYAKLILTIIIFQVMVDMGTSNVQPFIYQQF